MYFCEQVEHYRAWIFECGDPSYQAFKLGLAATVLLSVAHVIANLLGGCICITSKEELDQASPNKQLAAASLILSWILLAVAFTMVISETLANSKSRRDCRLAQHHLLFIGGAICFIHGLILVTYYVSTVAVFREKKKLNEHEG
ncbi:uncharacterized protein LOC111368424 [Olea europaea var. sylvestris]|uniref:uncharacterized protein LOC111368424 n=1 Tax=Olea europaea var. sylvestris TaxID=158386 RepID=UPI000C1CD3B5|nr:uncharacterized protein LOC111368424 [Olea europaea var. sylvestris]